MFVARIHIKFPIAHQGTVEHIVVHLLLHRHRDAVNADLQRDSALGSRPDVAAVRSHTGTRHTQQCWILAFLHRHAKDAIGTVVRLQVLKRHLIHVHILRATLGQQSLRGFERGLAGLADDTLPELREVLGHHRRRLQQLRGERSSTGTLVVLAIHVGGHVHTVEAGLLHRTCQLRRPVFQYGLLLHVLVHLRACGEVDAHIVHQRTRLQHADSERGLLTRLVRPVLMVWLHEHLDFRAANLCRQRRERHHTEDH